MKTKRFLAAAILVAISFTFFACSSDDGDDGNNPAGSVGSSSSVEGGGSSSGGGGSSSSSGVSTGGDVVSCGPAGEGVEIGGQCWLKKNLDVEHNSGNGESWCYEGSDFSTGEEVEITAEEGCAKYGRLYNWAAAMDLPSKCNSTSSASDPDCAISSPNHRGLCPQGFHVPTDDEWDELMEAVGGSGIAGSKLKAASGWYGDGNGTDDFGFAALPGGYGFSDDDFYNAGYSGTWWSSSENYAYDAYYRDVDYYGENVGRGSNPKADLRSVRCLQDSLWL
jgi:uncharacterized protein (TIGR02145 family)